MIIHTENKCLEMMLAKYQKDLEHIKLETIKCFKM